MGTWAAVTKLDAVEAKPAAQALEGSNISVAVVDTNAIISGLQLHCIAETAVTIPEVLSEVRDKHTRQTLANLPFPLDCQQPTEESVKAVLRLARATGDLHSLSTADIRLIALAHTLELARHGDASLRALPDLPSVRKGNAPAAKELPGWNETGGKWADMDRLIEEDLAEQELAGLLSKVSQAVQSLTLSSAPQALSQQGSEQLATSPDSVLQTHSPTSSNALPQDAVGHVQSDKQQLQHNSTATYDDADDWQKASSSHNAARKKKRKQQRRSAIQTVEESAEAEAVTSGLPSAGAAEPIINSSTNTDQAAVNVLTSGASHMTSSDTQTAAHELDVSRAADPSLELASHAEARAASPAASSSASQSENEHTAEGSQADSAATSSDRSDGSDSEQEYSDEESEEDTAAFQSSVASVTADFAMQNVILQMGLRLVAPNGMRIKQLSRWVLRCSACYKITKEPGRLFCPHCGNSTLEKVEAVIGPDGTEQYGVRKRFNTRGTRYSLPKPKGGFQKNAPILREDVLMQKLNKRRNRKPKDEAVDAFAPEYGPDSWFQKNHGSAAQYKGAAAALASWRHNPNERRHTRTNRRKK